MAIEHVLSVSARVAGKLDFVSASILRPTRTLSIVGHGAAGLRCSRSSTSYTAIWVCPRRNSPLVRSQTVSQPLQEKKEDVWQREPRGDGESNDSPTIRPSASTVRAPPTMPAPPALRVRSLSELPFYQANLQFGSADTGHLADLVAGAISCCPKNYNYASSSLPFSSGRCPAAHPAFRYIASKAWHQ